MKTSIKFGINSESFCSLVKYSFDREVPNAIKNIIKEITNYHPVFSEKVDYFEKEIIIHTYLPKLWKESSIYFEKLEKEEALEGKIKLEILEEIIKTQLLSMSTIPLIYSAIKNKLEITQFFVSKGVIPKPQALFNRYYCIGCGLQSEISVSSASSKDSHLGQKTQKDKWASNLVLDRLGVPIAKWELLENEEHLKAIWENFPKPCVIKPTGLVGGSGVTTNITSLEQALNAFIYAKEKIFAKNRATWQQKIMIQQQVEGEDYRILVINGKFKIATKRIPAFIVGDGKQNIREIIEETNKDPRRNTLNPTHILKPIQFDEPLSEYLKDQGLDFDYIPKKDEKIRVRKPASMSQGGLTEDFTDKVNPQIISICESIAESIHVYSLGIDLFCKDISKPLTIENGTILEINTMSEMYLNLFPAFGKQYPEVADDYIKGLLEDKESVERIVVIGKELVNINENGISFKNKFLETQFTGIYYNNSIYIGEFLLKKDIDLIKGIEALKINRSNKKVIICFSDYNEFATLGSGFNYIDIVYTNQNIENTKIKQVLEDYKNNGYIGKIVHL